MTDRDAEQTGPGAWGVGIATITLADAKVLDTWFPTPALGLSGDRGSLGADVDIFGSGTVELDPGEGAAALGVDLTRLGGTDELRRVRVAPVLTIIEDLADPPI